MYLNCHTYFSTLYGVQSPEALLEGAARMGINALALTDINTTSGCCDFVRMGPRYNIRPVVGIDFRNGATPCYIGLAHNLNGFQELSEHLSQHLCNGLAFSNTAPQFRNASIIYPLQHNKARHLRDNEYLGINPRELLKHLLQPIKAPPEKLVALATATFRDKLDYNQHRLARAIDNNIVLSRLSLSDQGHANDCMLAPDELRRLYCEAPRLVRNAEALLERCSIDFAFKQSKNKKHFLGSAAEDAQAIKAMAEEGLIYRYGNPTQGQKERLAHELHLITSLGFSAYFLINEDIVRYARNKGYFYVGRGSGANSLVAYCMKITDVDPIELDLYFERFINPSRKSPPDFDIDFSWRDREDVTSYIFERHGHGHTALLGAYSTFKWKSAIRELGKVFGLPDSEIKALEEDVLPEHKLDEYGKLVYKYVPRFNEVPRHVTVHSCGILISEEPITRYTGLFMPPKGYRTTQFSMLEAEDIGLYKFDILSQRGLGHIRDTVSIVKENQGLDIDIHNVATFKNDPRCNKLLKTGKTIGAFYVESPAMRQLLKKLEVDEYLGLVAASSVIRPGVASSGMMRAYIERYRDPERRQDAIPALLKIMPDTYGVMVYQEDVIRVAHEYAGLTLAESDVMRRGMSGKFRSREEFQKIKERFFSNCNEMGRTAEEASEVWRQIESFAGYSFAKGHSASYAVESYQSLYLKAYYPLEFMVGVINNFGGFYGTEHYIHEAKMLGGAIELPCINRSWNESSIEGNTIQLGFQHIKSLESKTVEAILLARHDGPFRDFKNFLKRVPIALTQVRILISIGAFRFTAKEKKELRWEARLFFGEEVKTKPSLELFDNGMEHFDFPQFEHVEHEDVMEEIELLGFPYRSPFQLLATDYRGDVMTHELACYIGKEIKMLGYLINTKRVTTIHNETMTFGCFIDAEGSFFDTVHFPPALAKYPFKGRFCYELVGKVSEDFQVPSLEVSYMKRLSWAFEEQALALGR